MEAEKEKTNPNVEKILSKIAELEKKIDSQTTSSAKSEETHEETHEHWKAEDLLKNDCPECKKEIEKIGKDYQETHWREKLPVVCENCGTGVLVEEEECPKCKGRKAKKRI